MFVVSFRSRTTGIRRRYSARLHPLVIWHVGLAIDGDCGPTLSAAKFRDGLVCQPHARQYDTRQILHVDQRMDSPVREFSA